MSAILQQRLYDVLSNDPDVAVATANRTYTGIPDQDIQGPQIGILIDRSEHIGQLSGPTDAGMENADVSIDCWDNSLLKAQQLADAVIAALAKETVFNFVRLGVRQTFTTFNKQYSAEIFGEVFNYTDGR